MTGELEGEAEQERSATPQAQQVTARLPPSPSEASAEIGGLEGEAEQEPSVMAQAHQILARLPRQPSTIC